MKKLILASALALTVPAAAMAQDNFGLSDRGEIRIGVGESILGHTVEGSYRFSEKFAIRGMYGSASMDFDGSEDAFDYEGEVELGGKGVLIDFYPTAGAFRMSAGALMLDHEMDFKTDGTFTAGGNTYNSTIEGTGSFNKSVSPTVSVGFEKALFKSPFMLNADIGAAYTGGFDTSFRDPDGNIPQNEIDAETEDFSDTLADLNIVPFVKVGVSFAF